MDKLLETFFKSGIGDISGKSQLKSSSITTKRINRRFFDEFDIKFSIGAETFANIIGFLGEIGYDVIFRFKPKELILYIMDVATTHIAYVSIPNTEVTEYIIKEYDTRNSDIEENEEDEGSEMGNGKYENGEIDENNKKIERLQRKPNEVVVYVDCSIINDLAINKEYPIDIYIDRFNKKRFYIVNGKGRVSKLLQFMNDNINNTLQSYKGSTEKITDLLKESSYQKIVVVQSGLKWIFNSLSKKESDNVKLVNVVLKKHEIDFRIERDVQDSSDLLSGEDVLVYPITEDEFECSIEYFSKFNKLKLGHPVNMYCNSNLPLLLETKLGGGDIKLYFVIAPRNKPQ